MKSHCSRLVISRSADLNQGYLRSSHLPLPSFLHIDNDIYQNKKLPIAKAYRIFDSLVTPITLYCCELWTPYIVKTANHGSVENLLGDFGSFPPERLNQRISRMILSVHKKASSLAVLGETGRYPLLVNALIHAIKYEWHLKNIAKQDSLVGLAYSEMGKFCASDNDYWLLRVNKMKSCLGINIRNFY